MTTRRRFVLAVATVAVVAALGVWGLRLARPEPSVAKPVAWSPLPRTVTVEVLNAGGVPGAARAGAQLLRHAGFDVVFWTTDTGRAALDRTQVVVRRRDTTGVGRIAEALGHAPVVLDSVDDRRLVDLTVKLGRDYAPPPDRFRANP